MNEATAAAVAAATFPAAAAAAATAAGCSNVTITEVITGLQAG